MKSSHEEPAEIILGLLFETLAPALIQLDVTPTRLAQIARASFVKVGATQVLKRASGRPHIAKIAALTGLSRVEVKRIVDGNFAIGEFNPESLPRALRVLSGWQTSPKYSHKGRPRRLPIKGRAPSFYTLCKAFSGDIPHTVILHELQRQRRIVVSKDREWVSIDSALKAPRSRNAHDALAFAASFLNDALRPEARILNRKERISASGSIPNAYVESAVAGRVSEILDQMPELFGSKSKSKREFLTVYALVSRTRRR